MSKPKVSVLIPTYNYGNFLSEAIESVLCQSYKNFELIIVDNCSTDNTFDIVNSYLKKDSRIKYYKNSTNIGMYRNYNQAMLYAEAEYIRYLNADDKLHPESLERFVEILDNNENVSIVSSYRLFFDKDKKLFMPPIKGMINGKKAITKSLTLWNFIGEPTVVMFRRKNLNLGLFDISLRMFADLDMWIRHLTVGDLYIIDEVLSYIRIHKYQSTNMLNKNFDLEIYNRLQKFEYVNRLLNMEIFEIEISDHYKKIVRSHLAQESWDILKYYMKDFKYKDALRFYIKSMIFEYMKYFIKRIYLHLKGRFGL